MKSSEYQFSMTVRDVELLRYLFATKGAIGKQIHRDIFGNVTPQAMTRRLRALGKAGLIERGSVYIERPTPVYFVTKRA
ncbi:MAG: hypothetical protein KDD22_02155, partial [Bdellovibrionales bacterium]|nr:hypothetical protein [Bdellovibrionales bacterium]